MKINKLLILLCVCVSALLEKHIWPVLRLHKNDGEFQSWWNETKPNIKKQNKIQKHQNQRIKYMFTLYQIQHNKPLYNFYKTHDNYRSTLPSVGQIM